jgi:hypothetical protein
MDQSSSELDKFCAEMGSSRMAPIGAPFNSTLPFATVVARASLALCRNPKLFKVLVLLTSGKDRYETSKWWACLSPQGKYLAQPIWPKPSDEKKPNEKLRRLTYPLAWDTTDKKDLARLVTQFEQDSNLGHEASIDYLATLARKLPQVYHDWSALQEGWEQGNFGGHMVLVLSARMVRQDFVWPTDEAGHEILFHAVYDSVNRMTSGPDDNRNIINQQGEAQLVQLAQWAYNNTPTVSAEILPTWSQAVWGLFSFAALWLVLVITVYLIHAVFMLHKPLFALIRFVWRGFSVVAKSIWNFLTFKSFLFEYASPDEVQANLAPNQNDAESPLAVYQGPIVQEMAVAGSEPIPIERPYPSVAALLVNDPIAKKWLVAGGLTAVSIDTRTGRKSFLMTAAHVFKYYGFSNPGYYIGQWNGERWTLKPLKGSRIAYLSLQGDLMLITPKTDVFGQLGLKCAQFRKPRLGAVTTLNAFYADMGWTRVHGGLGRHEGIINGLTFTGSTSSGSSGHAYFQSSGGNHYVVGVHRGAHKELAVNVGHSIGWLATSNPAPKRIREETPLDEGSHDEREFAIYEEDSFSIEEKRERAAAEVDARNEFMIGEDDEDRMVQAEEEAYERAKREGSFFFGGRGEGNADDSEDEHGETPLPIPAKDKDELVQHPAQDFGAAQRGTSGSQNSPKQSENAIREVSPSGGFKPVASPVENEKQPSAMVSDLNLSDSSQLSGPSTLLAKQAKQLEELETLRAERAKALEEQNQALIDLKRLKEEEAVKIAQYSQEIQTLREQVTKAAESHTQEINRHKEIRLREAAQAAEAKAKAALALEQSKAKLAAALAAKAAITGKQPVKRKTKKSPDRAEAVELVKELIRLSAPSGQSSTSAPASAGPPVPQGAKGLV